MSPVNRRNFVALGLTASVGAYGGLFCPAVEGQPRKANAAPVVAPQGIKTFSTMPRSGSEIASYHLRANDQGIEFLPKGEPLELNSYQGSLTARDRREFAGKKTPNPSTRRFALSVGIEVDPRDQTKLPALSSATILDYLKNHYVSVQARIQKDEKGMLYLHQRPIVATAKFGKVRLTEEFTPAVANSVKDMHSLGMFLPSKLPPTPENLRTVVLIHKHTGLDAAALKRGVEQPEPQYEFVFIRGKQNIIGNKLDLHCFITSDERTKLHYLRPSLAPLRYQDCSLKGQVYFSRYTGGDLIPADSVVRSQAVTSKATFAMPDLDNFVRNGLRLSGDALSNLNETLDAIIDGKIRPAAKTAVGARAQPKIPTPVAPATGTLNKPGLPK